MTGAPHEKATHLHERSHRVVFHRGIIFGATFTETGHTPIEFNVIDLPDFSS
jgi:hypothetical protein